MAGFASQIEIVAIDVVEHAKDGGVLAGRLHFLRQRTRQVTVGQMMLADHANDFMLWKALSGGSELLGGEFIAAREVVFSGVIAIDSDDRQLSLAGEVENHYEVLP